jgi:hypothetical protein
MHLKRSFEGNPLYLNLGKLEQKGPSTALGFLSIIVPSILFIRQFEGLFCDTFSLPISPFR